ncbi:hypothetical protein ABW19_dt0207350 [Dactylella cylindrospora]|nr:hypothetical protein ABW19_dt0207350 [Dactylella cylindrospora]
MDGPMNGSALPVSQSTCYIVHNSYQPLRDFTFFTDAWKAYRADNSTPRDDLFQRPTGWTTVGYEKYYGQWLDIAGSAGMNNVTLAMPHGGIVPSVRDVELNDIVQPESQSDFGNVDATASVVSPALNVLCYNLNATTVQWFISNNSTSSKRNGTLDPTVQGIFSFDPNPFQPNEPPAQNLYRPPLFVTAPTPFNVAIFSSSGYADPSMYTLTGANSTSPAYTLCALRSLLTSRCSTTYLSASGGGNVTVNCSPENPQSLSNFLPNATEIYQPQFKDISTELSYALSLNIEDAALSRILGIFASSQVPGFNPSLPSLAEAFAVLYSNALVLASVGAQFGADEVSNGYPGVIPYPVHLPTIETFHAKVRTVEYASGIPHGWQAAFYAVLAGVAVTNIFCLGYFLLGARDLVFDVTEIENLFCVAFNAKFADGRVKRRGVGGGDVDEAEVEGEGDGARDGGGEVEDERGFRGQGPRGTEFKEKYYVDCDENERFYIYRGN